MTTGKAPGQLGPGNLLRWGVQGLVLGLVLWFLGMRLVRDWEQLRSTPWEFHPAWLLACGVAYLLGLSPCAWFWRRVLLRLGYPVPWLPLLQAYYWGHLGKYVPGKALVVVLRTASLRRCGVPIRVAVVSVFYETLTMMAVGAAVAVVLLGGIGFQHGRADHGGEHAWLLPLAVGCGALALVPTMPAVFRRLAAVLWRRSPPEEMPPLERLGWGTLLAGHAAMLVTWGLLALSAVLGLRSIDSSLPWQRLLELGPYLAAAVSLAVVAGFLSLVPGGLAVREAVIVALLAPALGTSAAALLLAVLLRVVWLVSEAAVSIMLKGVSWFCRPQGEPPQR